MEADGTSARGDKSSADESGPPRVLVLVGSVGAASARLLSAVSGRGAVAVVLADAPGVMVELAQGPAEALIVPEACDPPMLRELLDAVRTYYPAMQCLRYSAHGRFEPMPVGLTGADSSAVGRGRGRAGRGMALGLTPPGTGDAAVRRVRRRIDPLTVKLAAGVDDASPSPLITQEELAMLLGPAEDDADLVADGKSSVS